MQKHFTLALIFLLTCFSQILAKKPVYPIIFIHGINSSDKTWEETIEFMKDNFGWDDPYSNKGIYHAVLNANYYSTKLEADIKIYDNLEKNNIYCINFDGYFNYVSNKIIPYTDHNVDDQSQSNESAIVKQGYALSLMIGRVLEVTGSEKIILVGHSMGGLAAREYLQRKDSNGIPKWWVDKADTENGYKVAKLVTTGTPHLGSNADFPGITELAGVNYRSEAVRDLRWSYFMEGNGSQPGLYLFGGHENNVPFLFHNKCLGSAGIGLLAFKISNT